VRGVVSDQDDDPRDDTAGDDADDTTVDDADDTTVDDADDTAVDGNVGVDDDVGVGVDLPADVEATLTQLLSEAAAAARNRETGDVSAVVDTVGTVARNKLPPCELRDQLEHGCAAVQQVVADEPLVAAEYLDAMERRVRSSG
jgi:hypothetical protein